ncbi:hypothetical protein AVEN_232733-1 [Araneus ventricosus]|uniref:Uncharacterized protein n=1 Tax=Araneus ventricosus TaxID=182803 RepID=A0A4Y2HGR1_ARAVE|nr:hypothetical protein AVEN_232733-1 [Araneus ventricosus]
MKLCAPILLHQKKKNVTECGKISLKTSDQEEKGMRILWNLPTLCSRAVGCSSNRRKVSGRRGAEYGYNNSRAVQCVCVPASTETPEVLSTKRERDEKKILKKRKPSVFLKRPIN